MRVAYADPPYFGCGARLYGDQHPDAAIWDAREAHYDLIRTLVSQHPDGWALSCNPSDLRYYLPRMPDDVRVAPWCKTWHRFRPNVAVQYAWEPLVFRGGRDIKRRNPMVRDWLTASVTMERNKQLGSRAKSEATKGAKPDDFCWWIFNLLGLEPADEFVDLFPGSGAVTESWRVWSAQGNLAGAAGL